jgi:hypothetical protein
MRGSLPHLDEEASQVFSPSCGLARLRQTQAVDRPHFRTDGSLHRDVHRTGWVIAGACTAVVRVYLYLFLQLVFLQLVDKEAFRL